MTLRVCWFLIKPRVQPVSELTSETGAFISIAKPAARIVVRFQNRAIAESENALAVQEPGHPLVYYLPRTDVDLTAFFQSETTTFCPRKGYATHYDIAVDGCRSSDAAWEYRNPLPAVGAIAHHIAFYEDRVDEISAQDTQTS